MVWFDLWKKWGSIKLLKLNYLTMLLSKLYCFYCKICFLWLLSQLSCSAMQLLQQVSPLEEIPMPSSDSLPIYMLSLVGCQSCCNKRFVVLLLLFDWLPVKLAESIIAASGAAIVCSFWIFVSNVALLHSLFLRPICSIQVPSRFISLGIWFLLFPCHTSLIASLRFIWLCTAC